MKASELEAGWFTEDELASEVGWKKHLIILIGGVVAGSFSEQLPLPIVKKPVKTCRKCNNQKLALPYPTPPHPKTPKQLWARDPKIQAQSYHFSDSYNGGRGVGRGGRLLIRDWEYQTSTKSFQKSTTLPKIYKHLPKLFHPNQYD